MKMIQNILLEKSKEHITNKATRFCNLKKNLITQFKHMMFFIILLRMKCTH